MHPPTNISQGLYSLGQLSSTSINFYQKHITFHEQQVVNSSIHQHQDRWKKSPSVIRIPQKLNLKDVIIFQTILLTTRHLSLYLFMKKNYNHVNISISISLSTFIKVGVRFYAHQLHQTSLVKFYQICCYKYYDMFNITSFIITKLFLAYLKPQIFPIF